MLSLAEYRAASIALLHIGQKQEQLLAQHIDGETSKEQAGMFAAAGATTYYDEFKELLDSTLREAAENAVNHYSELLGVEPDNVLISLLVDKQYTDTYWGATLQQRLLFNYRRLLRNAYRSSLISPQAVTGLFTKTVPFGAQHHIDRRVLLSTIAKLENDASRAVALSNDIKLIRWTLSHAHSQRDACDDLASNVDQGVVKYLDEHDIRTNPKGVYFVEELPPPPHPNCQCEYIYVGKEGPVELPALQRTFKKVTSLLRRLVQR